jgi:hypothetical protein
MRVGTKSVLFGVHCFLLHWLFVMAAWWKLYGFPRDLRLWFAFFLHDLGYFGKPNMDGREGECHPFFAAQIMHFLFDSYGLLSWTCNSIWGDKGYSFWWGFCLYHSRFLAKRHCAPFSKLCVADKLAIAFVPAWLYLPLANLSGEIDEYMALSRDRTAAGEPKFASMRLCTSDQERWYADVQEYCRRWVLEHKDGRADHWTPGGKVANGKSGVWK